MTLLLNHYSMGFRIEKSWTQMYQLSQMKSKIFKEHLHDCDGNFNWRVLESCYFINLLQKIVLHTNSSNTAAQGCVRWVGGGLCVIPGWVFAFCLPGNCKGGALQNPCGSHKGIFRWIKPPFKFFLLVSVCKNSSVLFPWCPNVQIKDWVFLNPNIIS